MIDIEQTLSNRFPKFGTQKPWFKRPALGMLRKVTHEAQVNRFLREHADLQGFDFLEQVLDYFQFSYQCTQRDRDNIPATGRVVIVANHPLGSLDGLALLQLIGEIRRDVKIIANEMLLHFKPLERLFLPVDNLSQSTSKRQVQHIINALQKETAVIIFPAGEVSRIRPNGVRDGKWSSGFINFAHKTQSPIVPIHIDARNSPLFYGASMLYKPLGGVLLAHEMFQQHAKTIRLTIGAPIAPAQLTSLPLRKSEQAKLVRKHLYRLAKGKKSLFETQVNLSRPEPPRAIKAELKNALLLGETFDQKKIYLFDAFPDSAVMHEIGRLRELTFRQVGEGTGKKRDLDSYDARYRHLVLWDEDQLEIAGAYRLAEVMNLKLAGESLYSETLFAYNETSMFPYFHRGIELGRSFVNPKYWGKRSLDYLWFGIGAYLQRYPDIRYLFGPVSLSNHYPDFAQALIVSYYRHYFPDTEALASAKVPYRIPPELQSMVNSVFCWSDADTDFMTLKAQLSHMQVTVPTLYKQYADVCAPGGVRFIDFHIDTHFGDCIDGLVLVDLDQLTAKKRERYLGQSAVGDHQPKA